MPTSVSPEQLLHAVQTIETELAVIKRALNDMGIRDEGIIGTFDGEFMVLDNGKRYQVPPNYASKSMLVPGDTLRMTEDPTGGAPKFKQIAKAERQKSSGLLTKKDGKFEVLCEEGSFKVLTAAVKHFDGQPGDTAMVQFAKHHTKGSWAAIEKVVKAGQPAGSTEEAVTSTLSPTPVAHAPAMEETPASPAVAETAPVVRSEAPKKKAGSSPAKTTTGAKSLGLNGRSTASRTAEEAVAEPVNLSPASGEIALPAVMDDDDLQ